MPITKILMKLSTKMHQEKVRAQKPFNLAKTSKYCGISYVEGKDKYYPVRDKWRRSCEVIAHKRWEEMFRVTWYRMSMIDCNANVNG